MRRVLVIEEDRNLRALLTDLLRLEGFAAVPVGSPTRALAVVAEKPVDLVLTEWFPRAWSASETAFPAWRRHLGQVPVVLVTGYISLQNADPASVGVSAIVSKPFDIDHLANRVHAVLADRQDESAPHELHATRRRRAPALALPPLAVSRPMVTRGTR